MLANLARTLYAYPMHPSESYENFLDTCRSHGYTLDRRLTTDVMTSLERDTTPTFMPTLWFGAIRRASELRLLNGTTQPLSDQPIVFDQSSAAAPALQQTFANIVNATVPDYTPTAPADCLSLRVPETARSADNCYRAENYFAATADAIQATLEPSGSMRWRCFPGWSIVTDASGTEAVAMVKHLKARTLLSLTSIALGSLVLPPGMICAATFTRGYEFEQNTQHIPASRIQELRLLRPSVFVLDDATKQLPAFAPYRTVEPSALAITLPEIAAVAQSALHTANAHHQQQLSA